ncbi:MAG TPA: hypothetical protein VM285_13155 [Polyangia bacterium]|nr:hypothetical protein [Polyangia bacterium]
MARKKIKEKTNRKDDLDPGKDNFIEKSMSVFDWAMSRRRQLGVALGVALLAAVAGIIVNRVLESRRAEASAMLDEALTAALAPVEHLGDDPESPLEPEKGQPLSFESRAARATETIARATKVEQAEGGSAIGAAARLLEAGARLDLGEHEAAIAAYEAFLDEAGSDLDWLRPNAMEGLGLALEAAGKSEEARARFQEIGRTATGRTALAAKYNDARLARVLGDNTGAAELLREVMTGIVEDEYDRLDYLFIQAGNLLRAVDPEAHVPSLPGGGMGGFDPAMLEQLIQAQQAAGGGPQ